MIEKIIHFTVPSQPNNAQLSVIDRARKLHPGWEVKVWQDPVEKSGFLLEGYWAKSNSGAQFADLLRLDIVYRYGGVYLDSDVQMVRALDPLADAYDFFVASEDGVNLTNAVFGAKRGHLAIKALIDTLLLKEPDWALPPNETTGPRFFASILRWREDITVLPRETFYTYNWDEPPIPTHRHAFGEHQWAHSWRSDKWSLRKKGLFTRAGVKAKARRACKALIKKGWTLWQKVEQRNPSNRASYACTDEIVVNTSHGYKIIADGRDISITPELVFTGMYEPSEEAFVRKTLRGGDWMIDVGANIGTMTLLAAQCVGPFGRVFSYEPNPHTLHLLTRSLVLNWMQERVVVRAAAASSSNGTLKLNFSVKALGGAQLDLVKDIDSTSSRSLALLGDDRSVDVAVVTLDVEFPVTLPIKLVKIDVEGAEDHVLEGARRLLNEHAVDFVMVELVREVAGSRWNAILAAVQEAIGIGYRPGLLSKDGTLISYSSLDLAIREMGDRRTLVLYL